jgi:hypothetical protein
MIIYPDSCDFRIFHETIQQAWGTASHSETLDTLVMED